MPLAPNLRRSWRYATLAVASQCPATALAAPTEPNSLTNPLEGASDCRYCHEYANDVAQQDDTPYAPYGGWQGSMMGNSARDPVFWAAVALAAQDEPTQTEDCIRCHAPRAFVEGRGDATASTDLEENDFAGVECEICHRMVEDVATPRGNARYELDDVDGGDGVARRGPWDYGDGVPLPDPTASHPIAADPFTGSSELCGTCHDVTTGRERVDDSGAPTGMSFNEQRTYSEWAGSAFAVDGAGFRSCQDCHMPAVNDAVGCKDYVDVQSHPTGGRRHDLLGANRFMLEIIRDNFGGNIGTYYWDAAIELQDEFLPTAATLAVIGPRSVDLTEGLAGLTVTVTNETGHKLPTGYSEGRVMWIEVEAAYGDVVVWSSGAYDPSTSDFERDDQVRTYEAIAENFADGTVNHLLQNDHWVVDSRIPPRGLGPDPQTDPVGDRYTPLGDGAWPNTDRHTYAFEGVTDVFDATPPDVSDDELTVTVRLRYLVNTPAYIDQLVEDNLTNAAGDDVAAMFAAAGGVQPVELAPAQVLTIPITAFPDPPAGTSSDGASTTSDPTSTTQTATVTVTITEQHSDDTSGNTPLDDGDPDACNCRSTPAPGVPAWVLILLTAGLRRRRW